MGGLTSMKEISCHWWEKTGFRTSRDTYDILWKGGSNCRRGIRDNTTYLTSVELYILISSNRTNKASCTQFLDPFFHACFSEQTWSEFRHAPHLPKVTCSSGFSRYGCIS